MEEKTHILYRGTIHNIIRETKTLYITEKDRFSKKTKRLQWADTDIWSSYNAEYFETLTTKEVVEHNKREIYWGKVRSFRKTITENIEGETTLSKLIEIEAILNK